MVKKVVMYTDGACRGNPGVGGWGVVLRYVHPESGKHHEKHLMGFEQSTTNNKMELRAVIEGLSALKHACEVEVYTDSRYVIQGITEWIRNWAQKDWKNAAGKPVKNKELWQKLWELAQVHSSVNWYWVKGHSGDPGNELADELANRAIDQRKD